MKREKVDISAFYRNMTENMSRFYVRSILNYLKATRAKRFGFKFRRWE